MATSDRPPPLLVILQSHLCRMTSNGGGQSLVAIKRAPALQPPETIRCRKLVGVITSDYLVQPSPAWPLHWLTATN